MEVTSISGSPRTSFSGTSCSSWDSLTSSSLSWKRQASSQGHDSLAAFPKDDTHPTNRCQRTKSKASPCNNNTRSGLWFWVNKFSEDNRSGPLLEEPRQVRVIDLQNGRVLLGVLQVGRIAGAAVQIDVLQHLIGDATHVEAHYVGVAHVAQGIHIDLKIA